jgi:hypothetical protein
MFADKSSWNTRCHLLQPPEANDYPCGDDGEADKCPHHEDQKADDNGP